MTEPSSTDAEDIDWRAMCLQLMKEGDQVTRFWFDSMHREDAMRRQRDMWIAVASVCASLAAASIIYSYD